MNEYLILGNTWTDWGIALLFLVGSIVIMKVLAMLGKRFVHPWVERTDNLVDDAIYHALEAPIKFGVVLLGIWLALHQLVCPDSVVMVVDKAYRILIVLNITWVFVRFSAHLIRHRRVEDVETRRMMPIVRRAVVALLWVIGLVMALSNVGVDIRALLGTLGIGGIAFALAAQDTVKNVFGAFTILTDKPFHIGDTIRVDGLEGTVVDIGMRSTRILGYDRRIITYPNYKLMDTSVINISSEPMRRVTVNLRLDYDTSSEVMQQTLKLLRTIPAQVKDLSDHPSDISVNFAAYSEAALIITCYYYIKKGKDILGTASQMNLAILSTLNRNGIRLADPSQVVYMQG